MITILRGLIYLIFLLPAITSAFVRINHQKNIQRKISLFAVLNDKKNAIIKATESTDNGVSATDVQVKEIDALVRDIEKMNPTINPCQSKSVAGTWRVIFSTAPSPSNGKLGPFLGSALQSVNLETGIYANELLVGPNESAPWISACLLADWDDMGDGNNWKVNFRNITLSLFGLDLFTKAFDEGTSRIWTTTFLDSDVRIVRAGLTVAEAKRKGGSADPNDYFLFIMTRESDTRTGKGVRSVNLFDVLSDPIRFMDDED